jgi:hypothetical protein
MTTTKLDTTWHIHPVYLPNGKFFMADRNRALGGNDCIYEQAKNSNGMLAVWPSIAEAHAALGI